MSCMKLVKTFSRKGARTPSEDNERTELLFFLCELRDLCVRQMLWLEL